MSSAPDSERAITFGSFSLLGIALRPRLLQTKLLDGEAAQELGSFFSFFPFRYSTIFFLFKHSVVWMASFTNHMNSTSSQNIWQVTSMVYVWVFEARDHGQLSYFFNVCW